MSLEHLNVNKLHQDTPIEKPKESKFQGETKGSDKYDINNGYIVYTDGKKFQRWVDTEGNWQEREI